MLAIEGTTKLGAHGDPTTLCRLCIESKIISFTWDSGREQEAAVFQLLLQGP